MQLRSSFSTWRWYTHFIEGACSCESEESASAAQRSFPVGKLFKCQSGRQKDVFLENTDTPPVVLRRSSFSDHPQCRSQHSAGPRLLYKSNDPQVRRISSRFEPHLGVLTEDLSAFNPPDSCEALHDRNMG
jgi:hypothetical protein